MNRRDEAGMSYETSIARAVARAAEHEWKQHLAHCPMCTAAARGRRWDHLCDAGQRLHGEHRRAQAQLAEERRLDKLPIPGQGTLLEVRAGDPLAAR
jgi:hypothetical protein